MRRDRHIRMIIHPDGRCTIEARQFGDASCTQFTRQIGEALGGPVVVDRPTADSRPALLARSPLAEGRS